MHVLMQAARRALIVALASVLFLLTPPSWGAAAWQATLQAIPEQAPDPVTLAWAGIGVQVAAIFFLRWHNAYLATRTRREAPESSNASAAAADTVSP